MQLEKYRPDYHYRKIVWQLITESANYHNYGPAGAKDADNLQTLLDNDHIIPENIYIVSENGDYLGIIIFSFKSSQIGVGEILKPLVGLKLNAFIQSLYMLLLKNELSMTSSDVYLDLIYIKEQHRHKGIGTLLMGKLIEFKRNKDIKQIMLHVNSGNSAARNFYEKLGFTYLMVNDKYNTKDNYLAMQYTI